MSNLVNLKEWKEAKGINTECKVCGRALKQTEQSRGICRQCDEVMEDLAYRIEKDLPTRTGQQKNYSRSL